MKLATLPARDAKNRNGELIVVSKDNRTAVRVEPATSLLAALENWKEMEPKLQALSTKLNAGSAAGSFPLKLEECLAPLPTAPGFYDGSAFLSHVYRARKSRGDEMPPSAKVTPLMYQGVSDNCLPAYGPIELMDLAFGGDFEGEFAVITTDVPKGTPAEKIGPYIALLCLFNDITYRELIKQELPSKFGFLQSKPNSSYAPLVVTPDEAGSAWDGKRLALDVEVEFNQKPFGNPNGREMHFTFPELVAHAGRTRPLAAGSIIGCGTVSNEDKAKGFACLTEKRFQEVLDNGKESTPWMKPGDRVRIDVKVGGVSLFGAIDQTAKL